MNDIEKEFTEKEKMRIARVLLDYLDPWKYSAPTEACFEYLMDEIGLDYNQKEQIKSELIEKEIKSSPSFFSSFTYEELEELKH